MKNKETITIMTGLEATKSNLRKQSYGFNTFSGTGVHNSNGRNGGKTEEQMLEEEILASTPFRNAKEMSMVFASSDWSDSINLDRISITIPSLGLIFENAIGQGRMDELIQIVNNIPGSTVSMKERLSSIYSSNFSHAGLFMRAESELMKLGIPANEVFAIINEANYMKSIDKLNEIETAGISNSNNATELNEEELEESI